MNEENMLEMMRRVEDFCAALQQRLRTEFPEFSRWEHIALILAFSELAEHDVACRADNAEKLEASVDLARHILESLGAMREFGRELGRRANRCQEELIAKILSGNGSTSHSHPSE